MSRTTTQTPEQIESDRIAYLNRYAKRHQYSVVRISRVEDERQDAIQRLKSIPGLAAAGCVWPAINRDRFGGGCHGGTYAHLRWLNRTPKYLLAVWAAQFAPMATEGGVA